jgi:hypothetical protein
LAESNIPNKKSVEESKFLESLANWIDSIGSGVDVISYDDERGVGVESLSPSLLLGRFSLEIRELASHFFSTITLPEL